jgi:phosphoribosylanthranilate isomerase
MVKVKVCGITNLRDAHAALDFGADALGFIFAPSPRQVTVSAVRDITSQLPPFTCKVGVFVNSGLSEVQTTMSECNLDIAQLHGDEDPAYCEALFPKTVKVFTIKNIPHSKELSRYKVTAFMLDKAKTASAGDNEQSRLWDLAREIAEFRPVILAGGLGPDNVRRAIETARPYAVDVSSGVESEPGKKDHRKLSAFITEAKGVQSGGQIDATR